MLCWFSAKFTSSLFVVSNRPALLQNLLDAPSACDTHRTVLLLYNSNFDLSCLESICFKAATPTSSLGSNWKMYDSVKAWAQVDLHKLLSYISSGVNRLPSLRILVGSLFLRTDRQNELRMSSNILRHASRTGSCSEGRRGTVCGFRISTSPSRTTKVGLMEYLPHTMA